MTDLRAQELSESAARLSDLLARGVELPTKGGIVSVGNRPPSHLVERLLIGRKHVNRSIGMKLRGVAK